MVLLPGGGVGGDSIDGDGGGSGGGGGGGGGSQQGFTSSPFPFVLSRGKTHRLTGQSHRQVLPNKTRTISNILK